MELGSVLAEFFTNIKEFSSNKLSSMIVDSEVSSRAPPRMAQLETLEAKMANIEVSLSSAAPRRRRGTSLGGISTRSSPRLELPSSIESRIALQDRDIVIQNLRLQLGLGKLPRPTGPPLEESERTVAEQTLASLKMEEENKRVAIRNLKTALEKLDITDNIDIRIRQAELEYALGREELQLLSVVEELRALQARVEKSKYEDSTLYGLLVSGVNLELHAFQANPGRWSASFKNEYPELRVDWALEGESINRGDIIVEINGRNVVRKSVEELQKQINNNKCEIVAIRKNTIAPKKQVQQSQAENIRLKHRICYLEDQVKQLLASKKDQNLDNRNASDVVNGTGGSHVTSISISSPSVTPLDIRPQIYQRGSFVTTIIGGKPLDPPPPLIGKFSNVTTTTIMKECDKINGDILGSNAYRNKVKKSISTSKISIISDTAQNQTHQLRERGKKEREVRRLERERYMQQYGTKIQNSRDHEAHSNGNVQHRYHKNHTRSVEHLYHTGAEKNHSNPNNAGSKYDMRSIKSLDFESDTTNDRYSSEPSGPVIFRPALPKKPPRLSLQRAQSLQTVDGSSIDNVIDKKRAVKRTHKSEKATDLLTQSMESKIPLQTASLGRQKYI